MTVRLLLPLFLLTALAEAATPRQVLSCHTAVTARPSGRVHAGRLGNAVQLPKHRGLHLRSKILDRYDYGTDELVAVLHFAADRMRRPDAPIVVGDLSLRHGGPFGRHASHQNGRDVDLGLYSTRGRLKTFRKQTPGTFDARLTWRLVEALLSTRWVERIFLDRSLHAPLRRAANRAGWSGGRLDRAFAVIRHEPGHKNHLHLRIRARTDVCAARGRRIAYAPAARSPRRKARKTDRPLRKTTRFESMMRRRLALSARLRRLADR